MQQVTVKEYQTHREKYPDGEVRTMAWGEEKKVLAVSIGFPSGKLSLWLVDIGVKVMELTEAQYRQLMNNGAVEWGCSPEQMLTIEETITVKEYAEHREAFAGKKVRIDINGIRYKVVGCGITAYTGQITIWIVHPEFADNILDWKCNPEQILVIE